MVKLKYQLRGDNQMGTRTGKNLSLFVLALIIFSVQIKAQSLNETLSNLSSTVGEAYVAPVTSAFGSNLNSGWISEIPDAKILGFNLTLKVVGMGSLFSDDVKKFSATGDFYFNDKQAGQILANSGIDPTNPDYENLKQEIKSRKFNVQFSGPTIVGSKNEFLKVKFNGGSFYEGRYELQPYEMAIEEVKGFLDELPALPTAAVQLNVGTVLGTNLSVRYLPAVDIKDLGKFTFWGLGAIHNLNVFLNNPLPLDLSVGAFYQQLKVGDVFETKATQFGVFASKQFGVLVSITPYAGLTFESSKTTVNYDYQSNETVNGVPVPPTRISFDLEGDNSSAFTVGFNLNLIIFDIVADYKMAKTNTATLGLVIGF
ncbi:DUF6588 family protein [Melioribacter roseus]|uniref:DUF6588 family protein n=1 Tax=Melioribacter roseus TaxID=1134405 RepID=UPI0012FF530C|nr:DUF6588 family protein [Melioribacter roseus]